MKGPPVSPAAPLPDPSCVIGSSLATHARLFEVAEESAVVHGEGAVHLRYEVVK